jgi:hypothetical protein
MENLFPWGHLEWGQEWNPLSPMSLNRGHIMYVEIKGRDLKNNLAFEGRVVKDANGVEYLLKTHNYQLIESPLIKCKLKTGSNFVIADTRTYYLLEETSIEDLI